MFWLARWVRQPGPSEHAVKLQKGEHTGVDGFESVEHRTDNQPGSLLFLPEFNALYLASCFPAPQGNINF